MKQTVKAFLTTLLALAMLVTPAAAQELSEPTYTVRSVSYSASIEVAAPADAPTDDMPAAPDTGAETAVQDEFYVYETTLSQQEPVIYVRTHSLSMIREVEEEPSTRTAVSAQVNTAAGVVTASGLADPDYVARVVELVNLEREHEGLGALTVDPVLTAAAQQRALELQLELSHSRPDGTEWHTVCAGVNAENIAKGYSSPDAVMSGWMNSQGHRGNILWSPLTRVGVSCVEVGGTLYWVQLFGI